MRADEATVLVDTHAAVYGATIAGLASAVRHRMEPGCTRRYLEWALDRREHAHGTFARATGVTQLVKLTHDLLVRHTTDHELEALLRPIATMNAYQVFEVVSDNLSIGLFGEGSRTSLGATSRRACLHRFHEVIVRALEPGHPFTAFDEVPQGIDLFAQSLVPDVHRALVGLHVGDDRARSEAISGDVRAWLAANVHTARDVLAEIEGSPLEALVRRWLIARYASVDRLLRAPVPELVEAMRLGTEAILVVPTVGYYVAVLARAKGVEAALGAEDTLRAVERMLALGAARVRLLNDLGPHLLEEDARARRACTRMLGQEPCYAEETLRDRIAARLSGSRSATRLYKDARHGEHNIALQGLDVHPVDEATLIAFEDRLEWIAYHAQRLEGELDDACREVEARTELSFIAALVRDFVSFHERLYAASYDTETGEYAI